MQISKPSALRLVLVVAALCLGAVAQHLVSTGSLRWAITPYLVAVAAMALAVANRPLSPFSVGHGPIQTQDSTPAKRPSHVESSRSLEQLLGIGAFALTAVMLGVSLGLFSNGSPNTTAWYLYGASVILLLFALPSLDGCWTRLVSRVREGQRFSFELQAALPWAALAAILVLALGMRLYHLQELPAGLWYDEANNIAQARHIQSDPGSTPAYVPAADLPSLFLMPVAAVIEVTGVTLTAGRVVSVAFALAGIVALFLLVRLMLGPFMGLVAAFLMAVMRWDLIWSRVGMHGITAPLFAALTAYLTLRALRTGRVSDFGYAGAALGLGMWFYASFRLFPLVIGFMLLHYLVFQRPEMRRFLGQTLAMGLVALVVAAPVVRAASADSDQFFARTRTTSVFSDRPAGDVPGEILTSLGRHALMFNYEGDDNPRHNLPGTPMLDFLSGMLLVIGLGVALARWRNVAMAGLIAWLVLMSLPGVLTLPSEAPQSLRAIGVIPAVVGVITLAIGAVCWVGRRAPWPAVRQATPVILAAALGGIAFVNINTYFGKQAQDPEVYAAFSTSETLLARDMVRHQRQGYSLLTSRQFLHSLSVALLADNPHYEAIQTPADIPLDPAKFSLGAAIHLEPREASVYRLLRSYYPDGVFQEIRPPGGGDALLYSAVINRQQMQARQGLSARYTLPDGTVRVTTQPTGEAVWLAEVESHEVPFDLVWEGALHITEPGEYLLALDGDADAEVVLDGRPVLGRGQTSVRVQPAVGLHSLQVNGHVRDRASVLRLLWQPPGGRLEPVQPGNLYHGSVRPVGLAGRFFQTKSEGDSADAAHVTPAVDVFFYDPVVPEPYLAIWDGSLEVSVSGSYRFLVRGAGTVALFLDGELVAQSPHTEDVGSGPTVDLKAGSHPIRVEYYSEAPPSEFAVLWAPPGALLEPIPIEHLSPAPEHMFRIVSER